MKPSPLHQWAIVSLLVAALGGCGLQRSERRAVPRAAPIAVAESPPVSPPDVDIGPSSVPPLSIEAPVPSCACAETKNKPKPRPRPKPVHKEAPPQLPTAPVVVETPAGGIVDAQVKTMTASVMSILGKRVKGPTGEDLGRVVDVLADASGRVRVAIIDFGGFLGVGNHRIAVDWPLLRFNPEGRDPSLMLSLSREKLAAAPEYKEGDHPQTLMEPPSAAATGAAPTTPTPAAPVDESKK